MRLPQEVQKKVKLLEISTRKLVNSLFAGEYHSAFKGQGMTFSEFREYVAGDDVRAISWPLSARTGKMYIKKFEEERELTLLLAVDVSGSTDFGSGPYFKGEIFAHLAALLGFSALRNHDYVGLLLFSDQIEHYVPPKKGRGHIHRILRDLYFTKPQHKGTNVKVALDHLRGVLKKRSIIFLLSDFLDSGYSQPLKMMSRKHEIIACVVEDPLEQQLPALGLLDFEDAETGEIVTVDTSARSFRESYKNFQLQRRAERDRELLTSGVETVQILSGEQFVNPLIAFFRNR